MPPHKEGPEKHDRETEQLDVLVPQPANDVGLMDEIHMKSFTYCIIRH